jgi:NAD(P)-dependent dehydrogenase (short-subunit alcohol dehydrogenase family)
VEHSPSIVITGSASGIGLALAVALYRRGCRVTLSDLDAEHLQQAAEAFPERNRISVQVCDVSQRLQLDALWKSAAANFGRVDIWVNNAGVGPPVVKYDQVPADWLDRALAVNVRGVQYGTQVALAGMLAQGGGRIYNAVGFGYDGRKQPNLTVYGTTKAAVRYFTDSLSAELGRNCPVAVSWFNPGFVLTPMTIDENRRLRARVGDLEWRKIRRMMNAVAEQPAVAGESLAESMLAGQRPIDRLAPARFVGRLLASVLTRPDPLGEHGL